MAKTYITSLTAPLVLHDSKTGLQLKTIPLEYVCQTLKALIKAAADDNAKLTSYVKLAAGAMPVKEDAEPVNLDVLQDIIDHTDSTDTSFLNRICGRYAYETGRKLGATEAAVLLKTGQIRKGS